MSQIEYRVTTPATKGIPRYYYERKIKGNTKEDNAHYENGNCDVPVGDFDASILTPNDVDKPYGIRGIQGDLQNSVEDHEDGTVLDMAFSNGIPDHDHSDASCNANHDDASAICGKVW